MSEFHSEASMLVMSSDGSYLTESEVREAIRRKYGGDAQREQTAATILAALTDGRMVPDASKEQPLDTMDLDNVRYAVLLTDALRAELAKGKP